MFDFGGEFFSVAWFTGGLVDGWDYKVIRHPHMEANRLPDFLKANNRFGLVVGENFAGGKLGEVNFWLLPLGLSLHKHLQRPLRFLTFIPRTPHCPSC